MTRIYPMSLDMSKPSSSVPATDCHFHVFEAGVGVAGSRYVPTYAAPLAQWQALAQAQAVERGVLVQTSFMGSDNRRDLNLHPTWPQVRGIDIDAVRH